MKLTKTCAKFLRKHGGTILAVAASVGVGLTAYETHKAAVKATTLVVMNKDEPMTKKEVVQECWKFYIPAAVLGGGTIACILGSNTLNKKQIASLSAAYMALGKSYQQYRRQQSALVRRKRKSCGWRLQRRRKPKMSSETRTAMSSGCSMSPPQKDIFMPRCPGSLRHLITLTGSWPRTAASR